jgi:transposase
MLRENFSFVDEIGAIPYIPFKSNSKATLHGSYAWRKMFHYFAYNKEEFLQHYHKRSNVETTFSAIKKKLGETLKSKNKTAQMNELLCKIIAYNITVLIQEMHELGIKSNFTTSSSQ